MRKYRPDRMAQLRKEIIAATQLYGVVEAEEMLGIVVLGLRKTGVENIKQ